MEFPDLRTRCHCSSLSSRLESAPSAPESWLTLPCRIRGEKFSVFHNNLPDAARNPLLEAIVPLLRRNLGRTMSIRGNRNQYLRKRLWGAFCLLT